MDLVREEIAYGAPITYQAPKRKKWSLVDKSKRKPRKIETI